MPLRNIADGVRLREKAYAAIKEAILTLELAPGQPLNEAELVRTLGVSRTPIRDALLQLEREGFVQSLPFRSAVVTALNADDVRDIFALREYLELPAVREAALRMDEETIARGEQLVAEAEKALEDRDYDTYSRCSDEIHKMFIRVLGNRRVEQVMENLRDHLRRLRASALRASPTHEYLADYRAMLEAVRRRDPDAAAAAMQSHLRRVRETILRSISEQSEAREG